MNITREQIIAWARDANRYADTHADSTDCDWPLIRDEHFATLVAAAERESCAKVCETEWCTPEQQLAGEMFAVVIRARGEQHG